MKKRTNVQRIPEIARSLFLISFRKQNVGRWIEILEGNSQNSEVGAEAARGPEYESIPSSLPDRQTFLAPAERDNIREESSLI